MKHTNLLELIDKSNDEISWYLEDVSIEEFKSDILELAKMNNDKDLIEQAIKMLQSLL